MEYLDLPKMNFFCIHPNNFILRVSNNYLSRLDIARLVIERLGNLLELSRAWLTNDASGIKRNYIGTAPTE